MMKTTTSNSISVKARRDARVVGRAGPEDIPTIRFDTSSRVDDQGRGGTGPRAD